MSNNDDIDDNIAKQSTAVQVKSIMIIIIKN